MYVNRDTIESVRLWGVDHPLHGVAQSLPQCCHLTALCIYMYNTENLDLLLAIIPRLTQLTSIRYDGMYSDIDTVSLTGDLMCGNRDTIESVRLWFIDLPQHWIRLQCLPQCPQQSALSTCTCSLFCLWYFPLQEL